MLERDDGNGRDHTVIGELLSIAQDNGVGVADAQTVNIDDAGLDGRTALDDTATHLERVAVIEDKDVIILDDMISSGDSILDVARQLKMRKAKRIYAAATFGLFTNGMEKFDQAYEEGLISGILTTNLIYQTPELLSRPYYINCDMSKYIAYLIDTLNHDCSISDLLSPYDRIKKCVQKYNDEQAAAKNK